MNFYQSVNDFPLKVSLGNKTPFFGLSRFKNENSLKFTPVDDEGFSLRGDRRRLLYKGRQRSHRFTILNDGAFEYDCILLREPVSNIICLRMEGAEKYDFFRQPDFISDPFLKGSYAVYKKETLVGEGTGKLCHIHRPLIIDALNRRCWGELAVVNNELRITIPEQWLSQVKYPVTVDPTIGTTTIGSQVYAEENDDDFCCEMLIPVNRFLATERISGTCTAYFYSNRRCDGGRPVFYLDNGNVPLNRVSTNESFINMNNSKAGWYSGTVNCTGVASSQYLWFGMFTEDYWYPRYDFGLKCYMDEYDYGSSIPNTYPLWNVNAYTNYKISMYFTYTAVQSQNYTRTLTQGVNLTDTKKISIGYNRQVKQNVNINTLIKPAFTYLRAVIENAGNYVNLASLPIKIRNILENVKVNTKILKHSELKRTCNETLNNTDTLDRSQGFIKKIVDNILNTDDYNFSFYFMRSVNETLTIKDIIQKSRNFIRLLYDEAGNITDNKRYVNISRTVNDFIKIDSFALRQLFIVVRILTNIFIRDFLFKHFLVAREELVLKSCITREITLDSKIS